AEYVDTVSVNFLSKSAAVEASKLLSTTSTIIETMVSVQDVQDLVQMLLSVQKDIRLVVQLAPLAVRNTDSDATDELAKEGEEQPHHKLGDDSHYQKGGEIGDRFEIEERVISHLTTTVSSIMTSTVADHVRIALVDP
ncbi:MAG: hypothetical protein ACK55I_21435, partial [bacterium]